MLSLLEQKLLADAAKQKRKIAIGLYRLDDEEIIQSLKRASEYADIVVVGTTIDGFESIPTESDDAASEVIVNLVKDKKVDGFVRGQLKDSFTHKIFVEKIGGDLNSKNIPLFIAKEEIYFGLTNPSNYNSIDAEHQKGEALRAAQFMKEDLGIEPKIAVMSTRRPSGRVGEFKALEDIAANCEETARYLKEQGYNAEEYYIEYEKAIADRCNLLVAATGMIANPWFKGLVYLGGWHGICAPCLDQGAYYDDFPRNNVNWFWPIISTVAWINRNTLK